MKSNLDVMVEEKALVFDCQKYDNKKCVKHVVMKTEKLSIILFRFLL